MNLYFLVEGVTERKLYPKWFEILLPNHNRVQTPIDVNNNQYYLISGGGFPSLLDVHLPDSIEDVNSCGKYDYFIIVLDSDEISVHLRVQEVHDKISELQLELTSCELVIIVQNCCIESWLLGNRKVFQRQPEDLFLRNCIKFYDVFQNDPELMYKPPDYHESIGIFHYHYLKAMLASRNITYSKKYPRETAKPYYIEQLKQRLDETPEHLASLTSFFRFCDMINRTITDKL